jgi:hypothetical protein
MPIDSPKPLLVFAVHGINTPAEVPYAADWREALGFDCEVVEARWDSTGSVVGDVFKILLNKRERNKAVGAITSQLRDFVERDGPKLLLAHSMGEPLLLEAVRRVQPDLPIATIGGPLSHPFFGNTLATVGLRKPTPGDAPLRFWNRHDGVCCSRFLGARQPSWMNATRIAVAGDTGWVVEHSAVLYLEHDNVRRAVRALKEKNT